MTGFLLTLQDLTEMIEQVADDEAVHQHHMTQLQQSARQLSQPLGDDVPHQPEMPDTVFAQPRRSQVQDGMNIPTVVLMTAVHVVYIMWAVISAAHYCVSRYCM